MEAEDVQLGRFLVIAFTKAGVIKLKDIYKRVLLINEMTSYEIKYYVVKAVYRPPSASHL